MTWCARLVLSLPWQMCQCVRRHLSLWPLPPPHPGGHQPGSARFITPALGAEPADTNIGLGAAGSASAKLPGSEGDAAAGLGGGSEGCLKVLQACLGATHQKQHSQRTRLAVLQVLLPPRRQGKRSLSTADAGAGNSCLPSCCTPGTHRIHTPLNTSLLLHQCLQLGSPVAMALVSNARDASRGQGRAVGHTCTTVPSVGAACRDQGPAAQLTLPTALTGTAGPSQPPGLAGPSIALH